MNEKREKIIGIYHKDCTDGTTAAAVLLRRFPNALVVPLAHAPEKAELDNILEHVDKNTVVYTVDCAIGVQEFLKKAKSVITLDHHISVHSELTALAKENESYTYVFNNDRSGASLTWTHFFGEENIPELILLVEDSDLWKQKYGNKTKYVNTCLALSWNAPEKIVPLLEEDTDTLVEKGEIMVQFSNHLIQTLLEKTCPVLIGIGTFTVMALNVRVLQSELGNRYSEKIDKTAVLFAICGDTVEFSFRSKDHHTPSALDLATILGGGGHKNSAGARVTLKDFLTMVHAQ